MIHFKQNSQKLFIGIPRDTVTPCYLERRSAFQDATYNPSRTVKCAETFYLLKYRNQKQGVFAFKKRHGLCHRHARTTRGAAQRTGLYCHRPIGPAWGGQTGLHTNFYTCLPHRPSSVSEVTRSLRSSSSPFQDTGGAL